MPSRTLDRPLLPGEYAVLGLLALGPRHGYDMARTLEPGGELGAVCAVEQSLLYAYLRNLEGRGLVDWEEVRVGNRPPRKIYALAEDGWAAFRAWVHAPVERMREVRVDLLLKLYFLRTLEPAAERRLVRRQVEVCERYLEAAQRDVAAANGFDHLVAESKRTAAEATRDWLRAYAAEPPARKRVARAS